jgi:cyclophilin family peptidyl-prolyl cis-trans isomerase
VSQSYDSPPPLTIDPNSSYSAMIETNKGTISLDLFADRATKTVNNFVFLAREGFYDGVIFHRVIEDFMIQGGDPTGTGRGGPGYRFEDELEVAEERGYPRGTVAMANAGPNTNGSQFFIMHRDTALPPNYSVFGEVTDGIEVVDEIATSATDPSDRPNFDVTIKSVDISES